MTLHIVDPDLNLLKFVASVGLDHVNERALHLPEKGRDKRAADLQEAFLTNEGKVLILHPDKEAGLPEILERLGINANSSLMNLIMHLEGNVIGTLALFDDGRREDQRDRRSCPNPGASSQYAPKSDDQAWNSIRQEKLAA
jgi:hypothetical protein